MIMFAAAFAAPGAAWPMMWSMDRYSWSLTFRCSRPPNKQAPVTAGFSRRTMPPCRADVQGGRNLSVEKRADRGLVADAAHRLGEQRRDGQFPDVRAPFHLG